MRHCQTGKWISAVVIALALPWQAHGGDGEAALVLDHFLAAEQTGEVEWLGNWLESYALSEEQVSQLLRAAQAEDSEPRRNLLWHAIRCSRSRQGQEYLLRNVVEDSLESTKVRFIHSLKNLAPFDVPLLVALYQTKSPAVGKAVLELALQDASTLGPALHSTPRPEFVSERGLMALNQYRQSQAQQARNGLLIWIATHTDRQDHRLAAIDAVLGDLDRPQQKQLAADVLAAVKGPDRAGVIPNLCRSYALDAFPLLVKHDEDESFKLAVIEGLHLLASSYGYSLTALNHGRETLAYVSQSDPSMKVRDAAAQLLKRINGEQQ